MKGKDKKPEDQENPSRKNKGSKKSKKSSSLKTALKTLGPGLVTGASDDDPSGIATYSQAGTKNSKIPYSIVICLFCYSHDSRRRFNSYLLLAFFHI
jgi:hypothetical protein